MADKTDIPTEDPHFETGPVRANLAVEQGLGVGARELAAQRDAGGVVTGDVTPQEDGAGKAQDVLKRDTAVQGSPET
jgi:hypothetical protein